MKQCPKCAKRYFADSMNFCLEDGSPLTRSTSSDETLIIKTGELLRDGRMKFSAHLFQLYCLFGYETDADSSVISIWRPSNLKPRISAGFDIQTRFNLWIESKRPLNFDDIVSNSWFLDRQVPAPDNEQTGIPFRFSRDGTCSSIVAGSRGRWELVHGALQVHMDEPRTDYRYFIIGSKNDVHSGLVFIDWESHGYVRMIRDNS